MNNNRLAGAALAVLMAGLCGCSDARLPVQGKVTLDGRPLREGMISFMPPQGKAGSSASGAISAGTYSIPAGGGLLPGVYRVEIRWARKTGRKIEAGVPTADGTVEEVVEGIPARYNSDSILQREVSPEATSLDFDLTSSDD